MSIITDLTQGATSGLFTGISGLVTSVRSAITGKAVLTPDEQAGLLKQAADIEAAAAKAQVDLSLAQVELDKIDAASSSWFQRNWRPGAGWVCVLGLAYQFLVCPLAPWMIKVVGLIFKVSPDIIPPLPPLDSSTLTPLLLGMLGLGAARTVEKMSGKD